MHPEARVPVADISHRGDVQVTERVLVGAVAGVVAPTEAIIEAVVEVVAWVWERRHVAPIPPPGEPGGCGWHS